MKFVDKKTYLIKAIVALAMLWSGLGVSAQERAQMISVGYSSLLDTYLSPEHYSGVELRYIGERTNLKPDSNMSHTWTTQGFVSSTSPRSENANDLSAMVEVGFGMHYHLRPSKSLDIAVGGQADVFLGGIYNTRNGNNPTQVHTGLDIAPSVRAKYGFRLWKKDFQLNYVASAPLLGLQFSPAYGQSYYEIFSRGNYDHNICFTSPLNAASLSNRLTLDIPIKRGAIRIGYLGDFRQAKLNDIKFHNFTHGFIIGYAY